MSALTRAVKKLLPGPILHPLQAALDTKLAIRRYRRRHGYFPNLIRPQTFNEKILHRMLFDRRSVLTELADKAGGRSYVESRLGPQLLPRLYCITNCPESIPFDELPDKFVVKPTHGSGWIQIVRDRSRLDCAAVIQKCREWLGQNFFKIGLEWAYKNIQPRIIVEELIEDGNGDTPNDYKLFVFGGRVAFIQVDTLRFVDHRRRLYSSEWQRLDVRYQFDDIVGDVPRPVHLSEMIAAAEKLASALDFIRIDFYDTADRLYFGEFTTTPGCGMEQFLPGEFDRSVGARWKLPPVDLLPVPQYR